MDHKGLLFIPDISGFTKFVTGMEIQHSKSIIQELLELLINANQIGLEVSEVEGDAILFYKFGEPPAIEEIYEQVKKMFCIFHQHLIAYEHRRYCQCEACGSAIDLTLKVVSHYGEFTDYQVQNFHKLIGKDVIVAHQLLKNDIDNHEYWLVTQNLVPGQTPVSFEEWMKWYESIKHTETGDIPFHYTQLGDLKNQLEPLPVPSLELSKKAKVISVAREYEADIIRLFHASGDLRYRPKWLEGVLKVDEVDHLLPRIGMRSKTIHEDGETILFSSSYTYSDKRIEFSETDEKRRSIMYYIIETTSHDKVRLTMNYYMPKDPIGLFLFSLTKKQKMEEMLKRSLEKLDGFVKEVKLPGEE